MTEDTIVPFHRPPRGGGVSRADLWEGMVRFMEANGRTKIEIGITDAREVAALMRRTGQ